VVWSLFGSTLQYRMEKRNIGYCINLLYEFSRNRMLSIYLCENTNIFEYSRRELALRKT
jgi:hypothetical protein